MVVLVGRGWFEDRPPGGCYRLEGLRRRLVELGASTCAAGRDGDAWTRPESILAASGDGATVAITWRRLSAAMHKGSLTRVSAAQSASGWRRASCSGST